MEYSGRPVKWMLCSVLRLIVSIVPLLLLALTVMTGSAHAAEKDVFPISLPAHPPVVIPGAEVPPRTATLSGAWEGTWSNGRKSALVVYRVGKDRADVLHAFGETADSLPWHQWARATIVPGDRPRLEWKIGWTALSFELSADGTELSGVFRESPRQGGERKHLVTMVRRNVERISGYQVKAPFVCPAAGIELRRIETEQNPSKQLPLVTALMERIKQNGTPLVEPGAKAGSTCATFLFRGAGREVAIAGYMNGDSDQKDYLTRVGDTDLFFFSQEYPSDSRIEYKLVTDGKTILDPLNPRTAVFGKGSNSEAPMPGYKPPREIESLPGVAKGTIEELGIASKQPGMARTATVYLPAGYVTSTERYPVLYLNDAFAALKFGKITTILDNLIHRKAIPPLVVVLLPSVKDRIAEYSMNPVFEAFMVEDAVPAIDRRYRTRPSPEFRAVGGISAGATAALSLAIRHPDLFGKCMAQSTATKLAPLIALVRTGPKLPIKAYLDVGSYEADFYGTNLVAASLRIRDALVAHGCPVHYRLVNEGHGWNNWRARTGEALVFLFGGADY